MVFKAIKYIVLVLITILGLFYYFAFVKVKEVKSPDFVSVCNKEGNTHVRLFESYYYITKRETNLNGDTLTIRIFKTTVGNVFNKKTETQFMVESSAARHYQLAGQVFEIKECEGVWMDM